MAAKLSIVTTTYTKDRFKDVIELLDSVSIQKNKDYILIIVVERLPELVDNLRCYILEKGYSGMLVIYNDGPKGASSARNLAIRQTEGDLIAFVDDDAIVSETWVDEIIKSFEADDSVIGVTGPITPLWQGKSMTWFPPEFYWIFSCTENNIKGKLEVRNGYGTNLAFRREAFKEAGLFDPDLGVKGRGKQGWQEPGCEETELAVRITTATGKKIIYNPSVIVKHKVYSYRTSLQFMLKRAYWEGYGKALLQDKLRQNPKDKKVLNTEYALLKRIFIYRIPQSLKLLFTHPISAIRQMYVVITIVSCVGIGFLKYKLDKLFKFGKHG